MTSVHFNLHPEPCPWSWFFSGAPCSYTDTFIEVHIGFGDAPPAILAQSVRIINDRLDGGDGSGDAKEEPEAGLIDFLMQGAIACAVPGC